MSKAVLIINEFPVCCDNCEFITNVDGVITPICSQTGYGIPTNLDGRLYDCPLVKLPDRNIYKNITRADLGRLRDDFETSTEFKLGCDIGFNAFRDMILGTVEEN